MTDLHLIISQPPPGDWHGRLDVAEALEAAGWTGNDDGQLLRKNGAVWSVWNESDDSGLDCPGGAVIEFPGDTPTVVVVAACLAAAAALVPPAAAPEATSAPLAASHASSVSESAQSPTEAAEGAPGASDPIAPPRRTLTPNEYSAAWHAVEGAAGDEGADPGTVLHAVLNRLGIEWQDAARTPGSASRR